jgi:hypothetical protein
MITINGVTFYEVSGELDPVGIQSEDVSRPGIDYQYFRQIGKRSNKVEVQVMRDYNSNTEANAAFISYKAYESSSAVVVVTRNSQNFIYPNVFIHKVVKAKELNTGTITGVKFSQVDTNATILYLTFVLQVNS